MHPATAFPCGPRILRFSLISTALFLATSSLTGCGSVNSTPVKPGNTELTVAVTSTGNDQLIYFDMVLNTLILTDKSGNTVSLLSSPQGFEFVQRTGQLAPAFTTTAPPGTYVSATATVGSAEFNCVVNIPNYGLTSATYAYGYTPDAQVTVNLPSPITITGSNMGLLVNLDTLQSATFPSDCWEQGGFSWSITPTFQITPFELSAQPTSPANGKVLGLNGEVTAIGPAGNSFTLAVAEASALPDSVMISTSNSTAYQGVSDFSGLAVGTFVNMDGALQADSSVTASRIAVEYPAAVDSIIGPAMFISDAEPALYIEGYDQQGSDYANTYFIGGQAFSFDNAVFQISGQVSNLEDLPFGASFNASNIVPGQSVYLSSPPLTDGSNPYTELNAVTLIPQTINGTVTAFTTSGNFTEYSVSLASYDLFPNLAAQSGQQSLLNDPLDVEVYIDGQTQLLNSQPLFVGGTFRFYGLVFNDNGTLRMDCRQVNDGVSFFPSSNAQRAPTVKESTRIRSGKTSGGRPVISVYVRANPKS
ncbi:MAG TPA: DUF5666 domain-containing protein [Verrucomicrobiae bacterium]|nr:DUF5666 domain-containing protein [Verrucomicrobiae bacterium]